MRESVFSGASLRVERLTKHYGRVTALDDVTFAVRPGEVLGLIGPNGAGKTTLFECLGGVLPFDAGRLLVAGQPLTAAARSALLFYLPDSIAPWPTQSVRWVLDFVRGFFRGPAGVKDLLIEQLALAPLLDVPIGTLSKGC